MKPKKVSTQPKRTLRTSPEGIWQTFIEEYDEAWRVYGESHEPDSVVHKRVLEQVETACRKALDAINKAREEAGHAD